MIIFCGKNTYLLWVALFPRQGLLECLKMKRESRVCMC